MALDHKPIDYNSWNFDGQGKNLIDLLTPQEQLLWNIALPFQDSRLTASGKCETGHGEIVTYFGIKLSIYHPDANRKRIVASDILHDIGWSLLSDEERNKHYTTLGGNQIDLRKKHQEYSKRFANPTLRYSGYSNEDRNSICETIFEHDTGEEFLSQEDGLARDADKLWRYTLPHFHILIEVIDQLTNIPKTVNDAEKAKFAFNYQMNEISKPGFFYSDISKEIALIEIKHAFEFYTSEVSK